MTYTLALDLALLLHKKEVYANFILTFSFKTLDHNR